MTDAPAPVLAGPAGPGLAAAPAHHWRPGRRWLAGAAWAAAGLLVFACYLRVSQTEPGDSYGAVFTLQRRPRRAQWFDAALLAAGVLAAATAAAALHLIGAAGGFRLNPVSSQLTSLGALPGHVYQTVAGLTLLFGGDFFGQPAGLSTVLLLLHLAGLALAAWAVAAGLRRLRDTGLVDQLLLAGILVNLAAFGVWTDVTSVSTTREIVAVLPFGAVLAARLLAGRLAAARVLPVLAAVGGGYLVSLGALLAHSPVPPQAQPLTSWLVAHHLRYGLGNSGLGSVVTVSSGGRVALRPLRVDGHQLAPGRWEAQQSWFSPGQHDATFAVLAGSPPSPPLADLRLAFGPPAAIYHVGHYTVLVWRHENLLTRLRRVSPGGRPPGPPDRRSAPSAAQPRVTGGRPPGPPDRRSAPSAAQPRVTTTLWR